MIRLGQNFGFCRRLFDGRGLHIHKAGPDDAGDDTWLAVPLPQIRLDARRDKLPFVSDKMREYGKSLVSGQIRLMRRSNPEYYAQIREILSVNMACLCYISPSDFTVFGRYGNQGLKDELKEKNLCLAPVSRRS